MTSRKIWAILIGMSESWPDEMTARIAAEIKHLRGERSGQWLSDRTDELGHRVSRSTISEIETRRRKSITIADLIILAAALDTTPLALIYPEDDGIEVLPGAYMSRAEAMHLFTGIADPEEITRRLQASGQYLENLQAADRLRAGFASAVTARPQVAQKNDDGG